MKDPLRYERRFVAVGAALTLVEVAAIAAPLLALFSLDERQRWLLQRAAPVVLPGAWLVWWVVLRYWRAPMDRAIRIRRAGPILDGNLVQAARQATLRLPRRASLLRAVVMMVACLFLTALLVVRAGLPPLALLTVGSVAAFHGLTIQVFRALGWARVLDRTRGALVGDGDALQLFHDLYRPRLWRAALATSALAASATGAFAFFFLPIDRQQYQAIETWIPLTILPLAVVWLLIVEQLTRPLERFLGAANSPDPRHRPGREDPAAHAAFRAAHSLPYKLGAVKLAVSVFGQALLAGQAVALFGVDRETALVLTAEALVVTVGATLYEVLWHRATLRPLLAHLAARYRPPLAAAREAPGDPPTDATRVPISLRTKMLLAFGGLIVFACGLSLLWSFVQYKTLATGFIQRDSELRRDRIALALSGRLDGDRASVRAAVEGALRAEARDLALLYFVPADPAGPVFAVGGGAAGPPPLGERERRRMAGRDRGLIDVPDLHLAGTWARLVDGRGAPVGTLAVMAPGYRGRGASMAQPVRVLLFFLVLLLCTSMGIVVLVANDLTRPLRLLAQRADAIAHGDLNRPSLHVTGDLDEVGRLTLAFEDMRRALDEKLRSSTEINLSLEHEVSRRTAELSRRNRELAEALDALRRAQVELLRSEKMASMGRLVAGIAHEINNPVNAVVNTVGPLEGALEELLRSGAAPARLADVGGEVREMIRVIRSGARRTKDIVSALHNYSRGDETSQNPLDLHRGLDESLELLRHHLRNGIRVERAYGQVGQVVGNEGQLQQVFMNLITNAAQAIGDRPGGGAIRIATAREGGEVVIRVSDDGPGIPEELLPRIFDPFFTTKDVGQGSGLGLALVHGIVERHGGTIAVESAVGQGTTFTVRLPVAGRARDQSGPRRIAE